MTDTTDIAALRLMNIERIVEISKGAAPMMGEKELLAETALYWERENQSSLRAFKDAATELFAVQEQLEAERQRADDAERANRQQKRDLESGQTVNKVLQEELAALKAKLNQYQDIHYNGLNYNGLNLNPNEGTVIMNKSEQKCGKCGTSLKIDPTVMLASFPPQPSYYCPSCDKVTDEK